MGGAGGSYWAICWLFYVPHKIFRHSGPRLYPLTKSVGLQTSSMSCPPTYDAHKNIRWCKTRWCVLGRCGFRRPSVDLARAGAAPLPRVPVGVGGTDRRGDRAQLSKSVEDVCRHPPQLHSSRQLPRQGCSGRSSQRGPARGSGGGRPSTAGTKRLQ
jgi:hypothetical protein